MSIKHWCTLGATLGALLFCGAAAAADEGAGQTIYLDPDTGDVILHPASGASDAPSSQTHAPGADASTAPGHRQQQTSDATRTPSTDPKQSASEQVVHCPDGSLRMGSPGHGDSSDTNDSTDTEALCDDNAH